MSNVINNNRETRRKVKQRIKFLKWRRLIMGGILLVVIISVLFIYNTMLKNKTANKMSAEVIPYNDIQLPEWITEDLLTVNEYSRPEIILDEITGFVVHYTGNPGTTAMQNRAYFNGLADSGQTYASSNFIINIDGEIILCVPMDEVAYASNSRNNDTLSIEVCHPDTTGKFSDEAYNSLIKLLRWLCDTYEISEDTIIRHGDVVEKACPLYYMENSEEWKELLNDVKKY